MKYTFKKWNRDEVRALLAKSGISCESVSESNLKLLRKVISKNLIKSGIYKNTARIARAKSDLKFMEMKTCSWDRREAVSFNRDGFIGIAGWADNNNVQPVLWALLEWSDLVKAKKQGER